MHRGFARGSRWRKTGDPRGNRGTSSTHRQTHSLTQTRPFRAYSNPHLVSGPLHHPLSLHHHLIHTPPPLLPKTTKGTDPHPTKQDASYFHRQGFARIDPSQDRDSFFRREYRFAALGVVFGVSLSGPRHGRRGLRQAMGECQNTEDPEFERCRRCFEPDCKVVSIIGGILIHILSFLYHLHLLPSYTFYSDPSRPLWIYSS